MDQTVRNRLRNVVTQCRKLLEDATAQVLQGRFGIYAAGRKAEVHVEDDARMGHLTDEDRALRRDLLDHLEHIKAVGLKPREALEQLVREIAFTYLNRLCAYKMMEARSLIRQSVSRGLKSQGFLFYLADHPDDEKLHKTGHQDVAYRNFLDWLGGTLSEEIGVLFNPNDPANRLYPPQRVLDEVLGLINGDDLAGIWTEDETIGWVYQYFTPKELRDKARKESQAPRNSYELAFRNQFYTPRYVVEFLTDNTLGRTWYEMRTGETTLKDRCRYLVRRPTEVFLAEGQGSPPETNEVRDDLSQEELLKQPVHISHRPKKDPREIRILDPACGSGHFLLYCFDLLQVIYEEAYDDPDLGTELQKDYPAISDLRRAVPGLILKHNLHGIDIDLRATQIAALALWLRCQRAYQQLGLKNSDRPKITRSNIVCAEPMPGETDLLKEFTATLQPRVLGQLVETIFEKMKLAGEAGSLLKIEEEIRQAAQNAKTEFIAWKKHQEQAKGHLFPEMVKREGPNLLDFADLTDEVFLGRAEEEIIEALRRYATQAENGRGLRRRLFVDDAGQGFAFIDLCRKRYDAVLMNPPFGDMPRKVYAYCESLYPSTKFEFHCAFLERALGMASHRGYAAYICNRTWFSLYRLDAFRRGVILRWQLHQVADLGIGVLDDALVEAACTILEKVSPHHKYALAFRLITSKAKAEDLIALADGQQREQATMFVVDLDLISEMPRAIFGYWFPHAFARNLSHQESMYSRWGFSRQGLATRDDFRFLRLFWEVPRHEIRGKWTPFAKGGEYEPYFDDIHLLLDFSHDGRELKSYIMDVKGEVSWSRNIPSSDMYGIDGLTYPERTTSDFSPRPLPKGSIFSATGQAVFLHKYLHKYLYLGVAYSRVFKLLMELYIGGGDATESGSAARHYTSGILNEMPFPNVTQLDVEDVKRTVGACIGERIFEFSACEESAVFLRPIVAQDTSLTLQEGIAYALQRANVGLLQQLERASGIDVWASMSYGLNEENKSFLDVEVCPDPWMYPEREESIESTWVNRADLTEVVARVCKTRGFRRAFTKKAYWGDRLVELVSHLYAAHPRSVLRTGIRPQAKYLESPVTDCISYIVGLAFGRWDICYATGERQPPPLPDPFAPLPVCPPGMLQGPDGLPGKPEDVPQDYPISIDWDGILVDDSEHPDDIVRRVREVLEVIWKDQAEAIEKEACEILGVRELRDYFRKPANGGFWMDHVRRYSKSRRKAPIYWYLRSAKGNYGLWLYYHRLDKDILYKALQNYVEPKIRLEEDRLSTLRARREAAGKSGREAKQIEKDIDRQEQFVAELQDFRDKLRRAADLRIAPDLNDGVVLNIAPLWELVPWKEPKKYWEALQEGKYDWAHIALQLWPDRVKELCKRDRSVAIAHGLEDLCEVPPPKARRAATSDEAPDEVQEELEEEYADDES